MTKPLAIQEQRLLLYQLQWSWGGWPHNLASSSHGQLLSMALTFPLSVLPDMSYPPKCHSLRRWLRDKFFISFAFVCIIKGVSMASTLLWRVLLSVAIIMSCNLTWWLFCSHTPLPVCVPSCFTETLGRGIVELLVLFRKLGSDTVGFFEFLFLLW